MIEVNKVLIPNGVEAVVAQYTKQLIKEYQGNPLIEVLPPIYSKEQVIEKLAVYPPYNKEERGLEPQYRFHLIQRLFQYFQPLNIHIDLEGRLSRLIRQGYMARNPFKTAYADSLQKGYQMIRNGNMEISCNSSFRTTASGLTIIGVSGMGKTTAINRILSTLPQVIVHSEYKGMNFSLYQVVWLKLDCPFDGSIKGLCIDLFTKVDELLGTNYYQKFGSGRQSISSMLPRIAQIARVYSIGALIVDEIQHLSLAKSGGSEKMLNFFVTQVNTIGIPVVLVGTPKAMSVLQSEFRQARRGSGQGDMYWDRMEKNVNWDLLLEGMWDYQWTKSESPLTVELRDTLYEESQGITDIAIKLYAMAQMRAIATGRETITPKIISQVAKDSLRLVQPMLNALKSGNINKISEYEDIRPVDIDGYIDEQLSQVSLNDKIKKLQQQSKQKQQEKKQEVKDEAIGIRPNKAKKYVEQLTKNNTGQTTVQDMVNKAYKLSIKEEMGHKEKTVAQAALGEDANDIRNIIATGQKEQLSVYEALKNNGLIKDPLEEFLKIG
ncbi:ATP-binding protein [Desulfofalx alkaliphila]|uniref:ATP-binding protein n=1 Tax=Desulfofalx alkaliphila TaxID=105483 RepID=UPI0004E18B28|nr:ATP-binding protein [Desulfofalx alkaliphila]